jgi:hypothetical protein
VKREDDWNAKSEWMRKVGATAASFDTDGALLSLELSPVPPVPSEPEGEDKEVESPGTAERRKKAEAAAAKQKTTFGAAGGLVPRVPWGHE